MILVKSFFVLVVLLPLFAGCASPPRFYNPESLDSNYLAILYTSKRYIDGSKSMWAPLKSSIDSITQSDGKKIKQLSRDNMLGEYLKASLVEGEYLVQTLCVRGQVYANPIVKVDLIAGQEYVLVCLGDVEENGFFKRDFHYAAVIVPIEKFREMENAEINVK